jgi:hypothetical protein
MEKTMKLKLVIMTVGAGLYVLAGPVAAPVNAAETCTWRGTAPVCAGSCQGGERQAMTASRGDNLDVLVPAGVNISNPFGEPCFTGSKALCCKTEAAAPAAPPPLSAPTAEFCNWYASEAVARSAQGVKCGFSGSRWDPNRQFHYDWCMQQKSQQQGWSEHNARAGQLADCAKKGTAEQNTPPNPNAGQSAGAPVVTVPQDVDVYKEPGGVGEPIGVLRKDSRPQLYESRPDQWCRVAGNDVPTGGGWVWCGAGFELR